MSYQTDNYFERKWTRFDEPTDRIAIACYRFRAVLVLSCVQISKILFMTLNERQSTISSVLLILDFKFDIWILINFLCDVSIDFFMHTLSSKNSLI